MKYYKLGPGFFISLDEETKKVIEVLNTDEKKMIGLVVTNQYYLNTKYRVTSTVNAFVEIDAAEFEEAYQHTKSAI